MRLESKVADARRRSRSGRRGRQGPSHGGAHLGRGLAYGLGAFLCGGALLCGPALADSTGTTQTGLARCAGLQAAETRLACFDALAARVAPRSAPLPPPSRPMAAPGGPRPSLDRPGEDARGPVREALGVRPYRANYLLPVAYNANPNRNVAAGEALDLPFLEGALDDVEMKFQLSFEVPLWTRLLQQDLDLYFAYTQLAFFQAYNQEYSSPFRETNYEPELGLNWAPDLAALGWRLSSARLALNHQSNGRSEPLSRGWNRLLLQLHGERGDLSLGLRLWALLDEEPSDNPDIADYLGYGELRADYRLGSHRLGAMLRSPRHPTVQLDWSYPLSPTLSLYLQYFNGYGESLLDYDHSVNRVGLGFSLNPRR